MRIHIGNCGYSYFQPADYFGEDWKKSFKSVLQAYASKFSCVEINSSFYRIPKIQTAERWREEALEVNRNFVFTVKAFQGITHVHKFSGRSLQEFEVMKQICETLHAPILLLQSPSSFAPSKNNLEKMKDFFKKINRGELLLAWEPRGKWWEDEKLVEKTCREFEIINAVDPLRNQPQYFGKGVAYFRLHGFGWPTMYGYDFSKKELEKIKDICMQLADKAEEFWVMFNNSACYENALEFEKLIQKEF